MSSQDAVFSILDNWPTVHAATGKLPERVGNRHLATAPYDAHHAKDGWVVIAVASNKLFRRLMEVIGRPELGTDERYRGARSRVERAAEVNAIVGAWVAERTVAEVVDALAPERGNIPCSPVYTVDQLLVHPQLAAREMILRMPHEKLGEVTVPGVAVKLSDTPGAVTRLGPELGQHNAEVYRELLGLDAAELARLRAAEVI